MLRPTMPLLFIFCAFFDIVNVDMTYMVIFGAKQNHVILLCYPRMWKMRENTREPESNIREKNIELKVF